MTSRPRNVVVKGCYCDQDSERNGELVGSVSIDETKVLLLISDGGTLVRTRAAEVAMTGRNAQGVRLIRLSEEETLVGVVSIEAVEDEEELLEGEVDTTETDSEEAVSNIEDIF